MPRKLASVSDHPTRRRRATTITSILRTGSRRDVLDALRHKIARVIDQGVPQYAMVQLVRQLREIDTEIRAIDDAATAAGEEADDDTDDHWDDTKL